MIGMEETNRTSSISDDSGVETSSNDNDSTKLTRKLNYNVVIESEENVVLSTENANHNRGNKSKVEEVEIIDSIEESFSLSIKSSHKERDELCSNKIFVAKKDVAEKYPGAFTKYHLENGGIEERKHNGGELFKIEEEADVYTKYPMGNGCVDNEKELKDAFSIPSCRTKSKADNGVNIIDGGPLLQSGEILHGMDCRYKILRLLGKK